MDFNFKLQNLIDLLSASSHIHISVHYMTGAYHQNPAFDLMPDHKVHHCAFCNKAKNSKKGLSLCMKNKYLSISKALKTKSQFIGSCYLGITEIVTPIFVNDNLFCILYVGNLLIEENLNTVIQKIQYACKFTVINEQQLITAFDELQFLSAEDLDDYIKTADLISSCILLALNTDKKLHEGKQLIPNTAKRHWLIEQTIDYIDQFYNTDLKLTHISSLFFVNPQYLSRLFSMNMGITFVEYIRLIRIREAKKLLEESDMKIIELAAKVGFNNVTYFNLLFKKETGETPVEFRRRLHRV